MPAVSNGVASAPVVGTRSSVETIDVMLRTTPDAALYGTWYEVRVELGPWTRTWAATLPATARAATATSARGERWLS